MQMEAISGSSFYATLLSWAFLATNSIRILAYLPTIKKLLRAEATADCQSQLTWLLWAASNVTLALHLFETNHRQINEMILITGGNALMCCICLYLVRRAHLRASLRQNCAVPMSDLRLQKRLNE
jgi:hypothetical protein